MSLLGLVPLLYVIVSAALTGWSTLSALVFRPRVGELLANTVGIVAITVPLAAALGITAAWLVERASIPGSRIFALLLAAPLAIPAFVNSYGWVSVVPAAAGLAARLASMVPASSARTRTGPVLAITFLLGSG